MALKTCMPAHYHSIVSSTLHFGLIILKCLLKILLTISPENKLISQFHSVADTVIGCFASICYRILGTGSSRRILHSVQLTHGHGMGSISYKGRFSPRGPIPRWPVFEPDLQHWTFFRDVKNRLSQTRKESSTGESRPLYPGQLLGS